MSNKKRKKSPNHKLDHTPFLVKPGEPFRFADHDTAYTADLANKKEGKAALLEDVSNLNETQQLLWADGRHSVLIILQAMDAAGKDGAIRHVMSGVNPQGVDVHSFKAPSEEERKHHFLWRPTRFLPAKGRITIFNRSYFEEVLVVRVHPKFLDSQFLPARTRRQGLSKVWKSRYSDINRFEKTLVENDTLVLKFFLNLSKDEQKRRFLARLDDPAKNWKFSATDLRERAHWPAYMRAFREMITATSTEHAPWHVIPADNKWFARAAIADIIATRIGELPLAAPKPTPEQLADLAQAREELLGNA